MLKINEQIYGLLRMFLIFIILQVSLFWSYILIPASEKYEITKHAIYTVHTYESPNEIRLIRGQYKSARHLLLKKNHSDIRILEFDCSAIITDQLIGKLCSHFFNGKNQILSIELYERTSEQEQNLDSKIRSITYKDSDANIQTLNLWQTPFNSKAYSYQARLVFIFGTLLNFIVLVIYLIIVWRTDYEFEVVHDLNDSKNQQLHHAIKRIFLLIIFLQIFAIGYFLFDHL